MCHVLWICPASNDVWFEVNSPVGKRPCSDTNFLELWKTLIEELKKDKFFVVTSIMRITWDSRNALVFRNHFESLKMVVSTAIAILEEFQQDQQCSQDDTW